MQHHFVVYFDDVTKTWHVDAETTDARFNDGNIWFEDKKMFMEGEWRDWNDATSEALNTLIDILEVDSESDEQLLEDENNDYIEMAQDGWDDLNDNPELDAWSDNGLIEETDYLEEDDE